MIRIEPIIEAPSTPEEHDAWIRLFANRDEVAEEYARLILRFGAFGWNGYGEINRAIVRRWSIAGLKYIKERAWQIAKATP